jgi:hypothetical protein
MQQKNNIHLPRNNNDRSVISIEENNFGKLRPSIHPFMKQNTGFVPSHMMTRRMLQEMGKKHGIPNPLTRYGFRLSS